MHIWTLPGAVWILWCTWVRVWLEQILRSGAAGWEGTYIFHYQITDIFFSSENVPHGGSAVTPEYCLGQRKWGMTALAGWLTHLSSSKLVPSSLAALSPLAPVGWGLLAAGSSPASLLQWCSWVMVGGGWEWGSGNQIQGPQWSLVHKPQYFSSILCGRGTCNLPMQHA